MCRRDGGLDAVKVIAHVAQLAGIYRVTRVKIERGCPRFGEAPGP